MTRILVVEDEESFSEALSYLLGKEGFDVAVAGSGPDAIVEFASAGLSAGGEDRLGQVPVLQRRISLAALSGLQRRSAGQAGVYGL